MPSCFSLILPLLFALAVIGDPNDWVNVDYVLAEASRASAPDSGTRLAVASIARGADILARKGPWSTHCPALSQILMEGKLIPRKPGVTNEKGVLPPSKVPRDYLSWAPYHWPDCRWCSKSGRNQLAHTDDGSRNHSTTNTADIPSQSGPPDEDDPLQDFVQNYASERHLANHRRMTRMNRRHTKRLQLDSIDAPIHQEVPTSIITGILVPSSLGSVPVVGASPTGSTTSEASKSTTVTRPPAQAAAKTTKTTCTPSPTTSMAPSATWTTCPYIVRDGKANPDVRSISGPGSINAVSQYVLYATISTAANRSSPHGRGAVDAIDIYFLSSATGMSPHVKFGQIVRGPGPEGTSGTFTGILDIRGVVKVLNGILLLKGLNHPEWTPKKDLAMHSWVSQYSKWLTDSDIGKHTASRPNNHGSYYVSQLVATKIYQGSKQEAISVLLGFFKQQFVDQIAASGEQPFEAIRTRPYHYRCFNLEALITNAKLGDELGLDLWSARSKYGATIQTAMDFIISIDPKREKVQEALPHVAAIAAAYGDPTGKYGAFLKKHMGNFQTRPFWFYDQPKAFPRTSNSKKANGIGKRETPKIAFSCPAVFKDATSVEIDNGVFVTCEELRPLYEASVDI